MITKIDKETIDFLCKNKLTFTQFGICLLVLNGDAASMIRVNTEVRSMGEALIKKGENKYITELKDLLDRGILEQVITSKELGESLAFDNLRLNKDIEKEYILPLAQATEELIEAYPRKLYVNGIEYPATSCNFDDLEKDYLKAIKNSIKKHREIIARLTAYKERNAYAQTGIEKFVGGRAWESLEEVSKTLSRGY